jgi:23S rRNA (adenine2503-C2)-methyltransferase
MKQDFILGKIEDGVVKARLKLDDGLLIETVLMKYQDWYSACLSVMVGCPLGCKFCATGKMGFKRNLTTEEITAQIDFWADFLKGNGRVSHAVFMGMGEPFLNWENTYKAINIFNKPGKYNLASRHLTVSTAGIVPGIYEFTKLNFQVNLAISLHSAFQEKRELIMPVAKEYSLVELMKSAGHYVKKTGRKIFFEYALINQFNDTFADIEQIKKMFGSKLFHLNVIVLNQVDQNFKPSEMGRREAFIRALKKNKIPYSVRRSIGREINAACGQLANL